MSDAIDRRGLGYGVAAYFVWGLFPLFMVRLEPANAFETVAHRALWSLAVCLLIVVSTRRWSAIRDAARSPKTLLRIGLASIVIAINWGVMLYGVFTERVASTSLGYYINPLMFVAAGVIVLGERLRRLQVFAVAIATVAVVVVAVSIGGLPWISLALASSFATYGFLKKGLKADALTGLTIETAFLAPVAAVTLWLVSRAGAATFLQRGGDGLSVAHDVWLVSTGVWTVVPLLLFASGARRLPLNITGLLQYIAPTISFVLAIAYFHEPMPALRWAGFALVWLALVLITVDAWRSGTDARASRRSRARELALEASP